MGESKRQPVDNCRWLLSPAKSGKPWELEATQPLIRHQIVRPVGRPLYLAIAGVQAVGEPIAMDGSPRAAPYLHPRLATTTLNATVASPVKPPLDPEKLPPHLRGPLEEIMLWCDAQHRSEAGQGSD